MVDSRATAAASPALPAPPDALVAETWILHPPGPGERSSVMRPEAAALVDGLLARVARGHGALDVAIGEQLDALTVGSRLLRLGWSNLGDYARDRLGIEPTTARLMAKLSRELRSRPRLREAVRCGEVSARKAQAVLPVAIGDGEAAWTERARTGTVRALEAAVREARCGGALPGRGIVTVTARGEEIAAKPGVAAAVALARGAGDAVAAAAKASPASAATVEDDAWERVRVDMTEGDREKLERAMALAGRVLGARSPRWQRLEAICQEYLGAHAADADAEDAEAVEHSAVADWLEGAKAALEEEMNRWDFLEPVPSVAAPVWPGQGGGDAADDRPDADTHAADPLLLDARLRELARMRGRWDVLLGHLAMLVKTVGLWRDAGFASFGHYCEERLGMAARTLEQRVWLAKRSYELPGLREAMTDARLPYEKARLVARVADEETIGAWIERARTTTALDLRRELEAGEDKQMCARGELEVVVPRRVRVLVDGVVRTARQAEKRWMKAGECLAVAADHFVATWEALVPRRRTRSQKVLDRDRGRCQVPGCSRAAAHAHHVRFRSAGGGDEEWNLVGLCPAHHLFGVHMGWIEVRGEAPGRLVWRMAAPPVETESVAAWSPDAGAALAAA